LRPLKTAAVKLLAAPGRPVSPVAVKLKTAAVRLLAAAALLSAGAGSAAADPALPDLLDAGRWQELAARGELSRYLRAGEDLPLMPRGAAWEPLRQKVRQLDPTVGAELLLLIDTPLPELHSPEGMRLLYNTLLSVSRMKGLQYYSASRRRMRFLFEESYAVDSPDGKKRIADPLVEEVPPDNALYVYQKDLSFGENIHRLELRCDGQSITMEMRNLKPITYLVFPLVRPMDSISILVLVPRGGQVLLYGLSAARMASFFGLEQKKEESFYHRMRAIAGWFAGELVRPKE
jgi:hypothetical protein